jgi:hypothetical protein
MAVVPPISGVVVVGCVFLNGDALMIQVIDQRRFWQIEKQRRQLRSGTAHWCT